MTRQDALAQQPLWVLIRTSWRLVGGFIAPLGLSREGPLRRGA